jgi:hypothetical protein
VGMMAEREKELELLMKAKEVGGNVVAKGG